MFDEQKKRDALYNNTEYVQNAMSRFYTVDDLDGARVETVLQDLGERLQDEGKFPPLSPEIVRKAARCLFGLKAYERDTEDGRKMIFQKDTYRPLWN